MSPLPPVPLLRKLLRLATVDLAPLRRHADFRKLFLGQAVSFFGSMITYVAIPYQVYLLTHSSLVVGALGVVEFVPMLVLAFVGGALADAFDRRRLVLVTESGLAVLSGILLFNAALPRPQLAVLFVVAGFASALDSLQRPSLDALIPRLVDREELSAASAISILRGQLGMVFGPAAGGLLIATAGLSATYAVDVATFVASLVALALMQATPPPADAEAPSLRGVLDGLRFARSQPQLLGTYLVDMVAMFFGMPIALFPAIATHFGGPGVLGLLYGAPAVGSLLATVTSGWTARIHRHGLAVIWGATGWGVAVAGFGLARTLPLALLFLALAGAGDMVSGLFRMTIWNETIPDRLRGRLAGIEMISYSAGPALSGLESGGVARAFGTRVSVVSGGVLCVLGAALCAAVLPAFRRYDSRTGPSGGAN